MEVGGRKLFGVGVKLGRLPFKLARSLTLGLSPSFALISVRHSLVFSSQNLDLVNGSFVSLDLFKHDKCHNIFWSFFGPPFLRVMSLWELRTLHLGFPSGAKSFGTICKLVRWLEKGCSGLPEARVML